jgi:hypothetical protein
MAPPSTPKRMSRNGIVLPRLMSQGFTKLSMLLTPKPQITMKMHQPVSPW